MNDETERENRNVEKGIGIQLQVTDRNIEKSHYTNVERKRERKRFHLVIRSEL